MRVGKATRVLPEPASEFNTSWSAANDHKLELRHERTF